MVTSVQHRPWTARTPHACCCRDRGTRGAQTARRHRRRSCGNIRGGRCDDGSDTMGSAGHAFQETNTALSCTTVLIEPRVCYRLLCYPALSAKALFFLAVPFVHLSEQILLHNICWMACTLLIKLTEYSLTPTDDLIRFWRSKVKYAGSSMWWQTHWHRCWDVEVYLLVGLIIFCLF